MAFVEQAIFNRLKASTGLTDLTTTGRIYHIHLPQSPTYPAVTYLVVSRDRFSAMGTDLGVIRSRFQLDCWDEGTSGTGRIKNVANEVRQALQRYRSSTGVVTIQDIFLEDERDTFEAGIGHRGIYRVTQEYVVWSVESG